MISWGASTEILSRTGETALSLEPKRCSLPTDSCDSGINVTISSDTNNEGFTPNYLQYPELNHKVSKKVLTKKPKNAIFDFQKTIYDKEISSSNQENLCFLDQHSKFNEKRERKQLCK